MVERRRNPWPFVAAGVAAVLILLAGWTMVRGPAATRSIAHDAADALPDVRPRLPEAPKLPAAPIPIPK